MVDPSMFTPQYDGPLVRALSEHVDMVFVGRPLRKDQVDPHVPVVPMFYRRSEQLRNTPAALLGRVLKPFEHLIGLARLWRTVRRDGTDIVHLQWAVLPVFDAVALRVIGRRLTTVLTVHNTTPLHGGGSVVQRMGTSRVLRAVDAIVVHTEHSRQALESSGVDPGRISVAPHGPLGNGSVADDSTSRGQQLRLLLFGKVRPYKGLDVLIEALGQLPESVAGRVRLVVAGDTMMDIEPLRQRAEALGVAGSIDWELGFVSDQRLDELLADSDVMVLPYRDVDGSGVLSLARGAALPVLASSVGGFEELLADSAAAMLHDAGSADQLAAHITEAADPDRRAAMKAAARAELASLPGWDDAARAHRELYARLIERREVSPHRG